jgi:hypothetical protein
MKTSVTTAATAATPTAAAVTGAVGSVTGLTASDVGAIKAKTDNLPAAPADESLIIAATNSLASSIAGLPNTTTVNAIKAKTDSLTFTVSGAVDSNVVDWKGSAAPANTGDAFALIGTAGAGLTALGDARLTHLDADVSSRSTFAGGAVASVTGAVGSVAGNVGGNVTGSVGSVTGLTASNLDATISSRLATSGYTAPDNSDIAAIKAKTDNLPSDPADESVIIAAIAALPTTSTVMAADIKKVNGVTVNGNGAGTPWGP